MAPLIQKLQNHHLLLSAVRFAVVGLLGTGVDFSLFTLMQVLFNVPTLIANTFSYSVGIINNYYFHSHWTFSRRSQTTFGKQFALFVSISLGALVINNLIIFLLTPPLSVYVIDPYLASLLAKICAIAAGMCWNFCANHFWTFRT